MSLEEAKWLRAALDHAKMGQLQLAEQLTIRLGRQFAKSAVNKMAMLNETEKTKRQKIKADEMIAIADITGYPAPNEPRSGVVTVKLMDLISAGSLSDTRQVMQEDVIGEVVTSGLGKGNWIALKVDGDSMDRVAPPGSIIFADIADKRLIAEKYYVFKDDKGNGTFKIYRDGPPRMAPNSFNTRHEVIRPEGEISVVGRVRRVVTDLD